MIQDIENKYQELIEKQKSGIDVSEEIETLLSDAKESLTPYDRVYLARHAERPKADEFISHLIREKIYLRGDRGYADDKSIVGGVGRFKGRAVTFIGTRKGRSTEENIEYNFGMPNPEGYRKVQRLMKLSDKFNRPIINFIDTSGAYPGIGAEERGQGEAIAECLRLSFDIKVPIISVITGEGGSGGALALGVGNSVIMFENSIYAILSPEGFASIIWKDAKKAEEASKIMKFTAKDLKDLDIIDRIVEEDISFRRENFDKNIVRLDEAIEAELNKYHRWSPDRIQDHRIKKFRRM